MTVLWRFEDFVAAVGGQARGAGQPEIAGISIDSRSLQLGEAFFAIKGDRFDGHDFVPDALKRGAAVAVVSDPALQGDVVIVDDVLHALELLGMAARARSRAKVIGVTGSVGKTGVKEALRQVLSRQGRVHASPKSYNNHWGVPLTLAQLGQDIDYAVIEMGMNHAGEIHHLTHMARPHIAVITSVEAVHLEGLGSLEAIADAKAEILEGLEPDGIAVLPRDTPFFERLAAHAGRVVSFGAHEKADVRLIDASYQANGSCVRADVMGEEATYKIASPGRHMVLNSLAVLAAAKLAGADLALAALELARFTPPGGRGEQKTLTLAEGDALLIDESYNANPASMRAAIDVLAHAQIGFRGRRIAVLGDMLELGPQAGQMHAALAEPLMVQHIDLVYCAGSWMKHLWEALPAEWRGGYAETSAGLEEMLAREIHPGDAVMIKGSNGSRMWALAQALERRFAQKNPVEEAL